MGSANPFKNPGRALREVAEEIPLSRQILMREKGKSAKDLAAATAGSKATAAEAEKKRLVAEQSVRAQKQKARRRTSFAGQNVRENLFKRTLEGGPKRSSILGG